MTRQSHPPVTEDEQDGSEGSDLYVTLASELIEEYEDRRYAGENPDLEEYVARYDGPDKEEFRAELKVAALLLEDGLAHRKKAVESITDEEIEKYREELLKNLSEQDHERSAT